MLFPWSLWSHCVLFLPDQEICLQSQRIFCFALLIPLFFYLIILYVKEGMFLMPSKWYCWTNFHLMTSVCYQCSTEGEEIPPSLREPRVEKLRTKFCEAALCPQSCGDALRRTLLRARHVLCHIHKLLEVQQGGRILQLPALLRGGCGHSLYPNHLIDLLLWRLFCYKNLSGIWTGKDLFRPPAVLMK